MGKEIFKFSKTKTLGFLIFIAATLYGFMEKDSATMITGWGFSVLLIGGKTSLNTFKQMKGSI